MFRVYLTKSNGDAKEALCDNDGKLLVGGVTVEPAAGTATEAKQTDGNNLLTAINNKLPAAPATEGKQDTGNTTLAALNAKLPAAQALSNSMSTPTTTLVGACCVAREENSNTRREVACNGSQWLHTVANDPTIATASRSSAFEKQRGINFSFAIKEFRAYSKEAGWIFLINKNAAGINGDAPAGACVYPIQAGAHAADVFESPEVFASGLQIAFSTTEETLTLPASNPCRFTFRGS